MFPIEKNSSRIGRCGWIDLLFIDQISYPVRPYVPELIQCRHCWKCGHSSLVCIRDLRIQYVVNVKM